MTNRSSQLSLENFSGRITSIDESKKMKRKSPEGIATNDLIFSAYTGDNADIFPYVLELYVPLGSIIADVTYGTGVFWKNIPVNTYKLLKTDIKTGVDCRDLPYENEEIDCVVLDPPYMHSPGGTAHVGHQGYEKYYQNNGAGNQTTKKYHEAVLVSCPINKYN